MKRFMLAGLAVLALPTATAHAAAPFTAGTGNGPDVATGADGVGHVAFINTDGPGDFVGYCRVPAGAGGACDVSKPLAFPGGAAAVATNNDAQVFAPAPGKVVILASCFICGTGGAADRTFRFVSTDNGATFDAGTEVGSLAIGGGAQGTWVEALGLFVAAAGARVQAMTGPPPSTTEVVASPFSTNYEPSVVPIPGSTRLLYAVNDLDVFRFATYNGASPAVADINTQTNWATNLVPTASETDNVSETTLTSGSKGVFLTYRFFVPLDNHLILRRFDPATNNFSAPAFVEGGSPIDNSVDYPDSFQDPAGRLHLVWRSLFDGGRLRYSVTDSGGATFSPTANLGTKETYVDPNVSANAAGKGWAVWQGIGSSPIRVVALDPQPEPGTATYTGPSKTKTTSVKGGTITFSTPRNCVAAGSSFKVTLRWKRKKRKGNLFVKVTRADFYFGSKRVKIDRKAPFVQTLKIVDARPGTTYRLRARAFIKVRRGRGPKKSITATIRTCT